NSWIFGHAQVAKIDRSERKRNRVKALLVANNVMSPRAAHQNRLFPGLRDILSGAAGTNVIAASLHVVDHPRRPGAHRKSGVVQRYDDLLESLLAHLCTYVGI